MVLSHETPKEIIPAFKKHRTDPVILCINHDCIEGVQTFKFPTTVISAALVWTANTTAIIKGTAASSLPEGGEEKRPEGRAADDLLLFFFCGKSADIRHHSLVCQLHRYRQEAASEDK